MQGVEIFKPGRHKDADGQIVEMSLSDLQSIAMDCKGVGIADVVQASYKNGINILEKIRDGKLHLGIDKKLLEETGAYSVRAKKRMDLSAYE